MGGGPPAGRGAAAAAGPAIVDAEEGSGRTLRADVHHRRQPADDRAVLASRRRSGPLHLRRRRAVRAAVPSDAVLRPGDARASAPRPRTSSSGSRCSTATAATSSAARSAPTCSSCRRCRVRVSPAVAILPLASVPASSQRRRRPRRPMTVATHRDQVDAAAAARSCGRQLPLCRQPISARSA